MSSTKHTEVVSPLAQAHRGAAGSVAAMVQCTQPIGVISIAPRTPLAWSADGSLLAAVGGNGSIFILQLEHDTFHMSKLLPGHRHAVRALLFHPTDANTLVSSGADGIFVHDLAAGTVVQAMSHRAARDLALPEAAALVGAAGGAHDGEVECLAWAFDGTALISGSKDAHVKVWCTLRRPWRLLETIAGHKAPVLALAFCPAVHKLATAGRDASIKLWDAATLAPEWRARRADDGGITVPLLGTCESHGDVLCLAWAPDGTHVVSGSRDNSVRVWSPHTFSEIREVYDRKLGTQGKHRSDVRSVAYLPDAPGAAGAAARAVGRRYLMTSSLDGTLRVWRVQPVEEVENAAAAIFADNSGAGTAASEAAAASSAAASAAGTGLDLGLDDGGAGAGAGGVAASSSSSSSSSAFASDDATGGGAGGAGGGWDEVTRRLLAEIMGGGTREVAASGRAAFSGVDQCLTTLRFFEAAAGDARSTAAGIAECAPNPARPILALASSANAFALCALRLDTLAWLERQYDGTLAPGALPPGTSLAVALQVQAFAGHTAPVSAVALLGDDRTLATGSEDYTAAVYDIASVERRLQFPFGTSVHALALGPAPAAGGSPLIYAGGADYTIRAYSSSPADYEPVRAAYAARAAAAGGGEGGGDDLPAYEYEAARYVGHAGRVEAIAVDARGRVMASGGRDWSVLLWDLARPAPALSRAPRDESDVPVASPLARVDAHKGHVTSLRFSSLEAGGLLATGGADHALRVWKLTSGALTGHGLALQWESGSRPAGGHSSAVSAVAWGRGDADTQQLVFSGSWDCSIKVWAGLRPNRVGGKASVAAAAAGGSGSPAAHGPGMAGDSEAGDEAPSASEVTPLRTLVGHTSRVTGLDVAPAGDVLVSVSADCAARVWRTRDPFACVALSVLAPGDGVPNAVSAGAHIFVTGADAGVQVWPLRPNGPYAAYFSLPGGPDADSRSLQLPAAAAAAGALALPASTAYASGGGVAATTLSAYPQAAAAGFIVVAPQLLRSSSSSSSTAAGPVVDHHGSGAATPLLGDHR